MAINGSHSYSTIIESGVPQGTVLGPILFILFVNDMHLCVKNSTVRLFADDTRLLKQIGSENDAIKLQEDLNSIM